MNSLHMYFRKVFTLLMSAYVALLVFAGLPIKSSGRLAHAREAVESVFLKAMIVPGLKLFYRPYKEIDKIRGECVQIKGTNLSNKVYLLYQTKSCTPTGEFHFFEDSYDIMYHRFTEEAAMDRMSRAYYISLNDFGSPLLNPSGTELAMFRSLGDFFCHSEYAQVKRQDLDLVTFAWTQQTINYISARKENVNFVLGKWRCKTQQLESLKWTNHIDSHDMESFLHDRTW